MKNYFKITNLFLGLFLVFSFINVKALTPIQKDQPREQRLLQRQQEIEDKLKRDGSNPEKKIFNCTQVVEKIGNRKTQLDKTTANYSASITRIESLINSRIQELKTAGKDTTEIEANLAKFKSDAQGLIAKRQQLQTEISNVDTTTCSTNKLAFVSNVRNFNTSLKSLVQSQNQLKIFLRDNVVAKIKTLKGVANGQ